MHIVDVVNVVDIVDVMHVVNIVDVMNVERTQNGHRNLLAGEWRQTAPEFPLCKVGHALAARFDEDFTAVERSVTCV